MPVGTFHLLLGVLFFAVWFMAGVVRIRQRDARARRQHGTTAGIIRRRGRTRPAAR